MKICKLLIFAAVLFGFESSHAFADTAKDIEAISKAVGFMNDGPSGAVSMDILYDPANADSVAHADEIAGITSGGVGSKVTLTGNKITSPGAATSKVIFVTRGTSGFHDAALNKAAELGGLTVSTDQSCLGTGCVLVVQTQPNVDIFVSTAAAGKTGTEFASAFSMMITKK